MIIDSNAKGKGCPENAIFGNEIFISGATYSLSRLGGVVISVLAIGPKVCGFKPGRSNGLLRTIKIRSKPSFGAEVKPEAPFRKILRHVKNHLQVIIII
jgi:hypothetical protein